MNRNRGTYVVLQIKVLEYQLSSFPVLDKPSNLPTPPRMLFLISRDADGLRNQRWMAEDLCFVREKLSGRDKFKNSQIFSITIS